MVAPDVGGSFGQKGTIYPEEIVLSYLAVRTGETLAWIEDRREHMLASSHARDQSHDIQMAVDEEGHILGIRGRYAVDCGAYSIFPQTGGLETFQTHKLLPGPYKVPAYRSECRAVVTNKTPGGAFRAISRPVGNFVIESLLERAARSLGLDPVEVRRRNLVQPDEFPFATITGGTIDSGSFVEALNLLASMVDLPRFRAEQDLARSAGRHLGVGMACYTEVAAHSAESIAARGQERMTGYDSATVALDSTGHLTAALGVTSQGQSHETVFAQLLADEFGVSLDRITVREGDTARVPFGMGSGASRSAVVGGGALLTAARRLRERVLKIAAHLLEVSPADLELQGGLARARGAPGRSVTLAEIGHLAHYTPTRLPAGMEAGLTVTAAYDPPAGTWSNGCQAAVVEVSRETGEISLLRYLAVEDCGRAINPLVVAGQTIGGTVQGIGQALLEELRYDALGQPLCGTYMDYLVPSATDVPTIELQTLTTLSPFTIDGIKGAGEGGPINPLAAIANAVVDALAPLDVRLNETPFTPERVLRAIRDAEVRAQTPALVGAA